MTNQSILWRRLNQPGHEFCRLFLQNSSWKLGGTAVFMHDRQPCSLDYLVVCDTGWKTISGRVSGWIGNEAVQIELLVDSNRHWQLNGRACPEAAGCIDLDLAFSPSTNFLPIRRLDLDIGQEAEVRAAWLSFPSFTLEPLEQLYRRIGVSAYRYESPGGSFVAELQVNAAGFITLYPNLWQAEASI